MEFTFTIPVNQASVPNWKDLVDRWYQLDPISYSIGEAGFRVKSQLTVIPEMIFLGVAGGSNLSDQEFLGTNSSSPAKFVYTLPNVALSTLCQVMEWSGPTRCIACRENEPHIVINEAQDFVSFEKKPAAVFLADQKIVNGEKSVRVVLLNP